MRSNSRASSPSAALLQARHPRDAFATTRPFRVVAQKSTTGSRIVFSQHSTYAAAEALVAGLAKVGCVAYVEFADDDRRPGTSV
jgi:hypothetical protein